MATEPPSGAPPQPPPTSAQRTLIVPREDVPASAQQRTLIVPRQDVPASAQPRTLIVPRQDASQAPTLDPGDAAQPQPGSTLVVPVPATTLVAPLPPELAAAAADLEQAADIGEPAPAPAALPEGITEQDVAALKRFAKVRAFMARHGSKLWWLHSIYAMSFGAFVVAYASKGYDNARWMVVLLGAGWLVLVAFFRLFGTGRGQKDKIRDTKTKVRFYVMTLALKNLYQSMLFFLLPFYWKAATFDAENRFFVYALGLLAVLSTVDVVFDQFLMRWKAPASIVYFFILFACLNLVLPALLPNSRTLLTLLAAAAVAAVVFFTMHVPARNLLRPAYVLGLMAFVSAAVFGAYAARRGIPPVPMSVATGAVGPSLLADGRLSMHVSTLHESLIRDMHALTDIVIPGGNGNRLRHVWRHDGAVVQEGAVEPGGSPPDGIVRLRSSVRGFNVIGDITGPWSVDVVTEDGQLVGRVPFEVIR